MNPMILFIDIETTGLLVKSDRAVSIAWAIYRETGSKLAYNYFIVKPDGFRIPQGAINIHGITTDRALRDGESLKDVLERLSSDIEKHNPYLLVAHNIAFDLPIMKEECSRTGLGEIFSNMTPFCTMKSTTNLCKLPKQDGRYKWPKLNELHNYLFHSDITSAHDAGSDVLHCAKCFFKLKSLGHIDSSIFRRPSKIDTGFPPNDEKRSIPIVASPQWGEINNCIGMKLVLISAGTFTRGESEANRVTVSKPFYMQTTLVTQGQWQHLMGNNPSCFEGDNNCPVETASWNDVQEFIQKLNALSTDKYRLPTEAEWEYTCRAGSKTAYCFGDDPDRLRDYAWYDENSEGKTHPVAQKLPNAWGLYDMHGNVWEWVQDLYSGSRHVICGGSWGYDAMACRSADHGNSDQNLRDNDLGFRLLRTL